VIPPEQILGAFMFAGMIAFLFFGFPVAFSLTFTGLFFGMIGVWLGYLHVNFFDILPLRIWGTMTNFTLLAVPLFVFMGVVLEKSGLAEELLETMALLFGKQRGGIAISVVVVGAILAASTGIVGASVITMGLVSLPTMLRRGYNKELITGTICASGTLGQILPPSVILILLGDIMGVPVGDLYIGAVMPGLVLVALYIIYIAVLAQLKPALAPAVPAKELEAFRRDALKRVTIAEAMRGIYDRTAIISPNLPLAQVETIARESGDSDLLLRNERGELCGLISLSDLGDQEDLHQLGSLVLAIDLVNRRTVFLRPDDNLIRALEFFGEEEFNKLPIVESVDGHNILLGHIRYRDIIRFYRREHEAPEVPSMAAVNGSPAAPRP